MRRASVFMTMLVLAALLLAACGGEETSTSIPSTNVPPITAEVTSTSEPTGETATAEGTDTTTTPEVPVTGADDPSRLSNMIGFPVWSEAGDELGTVQDLVLDFDNTAITYVVVDANGRSVVVPWDSLELRTGTGTGTAQNGFALMSDQAIFENAPDVDLTTMMPGQGQSASGWDESISSYWQGGGTGGTETLSTPDAALATPTLSTGTGTEATAMPDTTATADTGASAGTGTGTGQGAQQMQGVMLATDILGATVTVSPQGNDQGTGGDTGTTGTAQPDATSAATTPQADATATSETGTGTGTGTGDFQQGTVEDLIIETQTGDMQYLVVSFGMEDRLIPIPVGFLRWDATNNGFVLMINENALQNAPAFTQDQFPDTTTSGWDQEFSTFWQSNGGAGGTGSGTGTNSGVTVSTATPTP